MDKMVTQNKLGIFKNKRVLITGDTGFKGSWLSIWLKELGAEVLGFALPATKDSHFNQLNSAAKIKHIDGDIRDLALVTRAFAEFEPEFLFHLAAQPLVRYSYQEPKLTFDTNFGGSVNILEAVRLSSSLRSVIYVTSDKCYANKEWLWGYRENDDLGGHDPYSASKAAAELLYQSYCDSFFDFKAGLGTASVRAGNVIGGGDWSEDRIVPDSIRALQAQQPIILRNPTATRPWQHVLEPLSGYLLLAAHLYTDPKKYSGSWNFGPNSESIHSVIELAQKIVACWGSGEIKVVADNKLLHEAGLLHLNCDKSHQALHWYPKWDFARTVAETVKWYSWVLKGQDIFQITKLQIDSFMLGDK
jgi:CDP-glucose 4,6-dehydratase